MVSTLTGPDFSIFLKFKDVGLGGPLPEATSTESDRPIRSDSVRYGRIWSDMVGFGQIQSHSVAFGRSE